MHRPRRDRGPCTGSCGRVVRLGLAHHLKPYAADAALEGGAGRAGGREALAPPHLIEVAAGLVVGSCLR